MQFQADLRRSRLGSARSILDNAFIRYRAQSGTFSVLNDA